MNTLNTISAISPLDGRYRRELAPLASYFSEAALMRYRVMVECEYLIALSQTLKLKGIKAAKLRSLYEQFSDADAERIKTIEGTTKHDVKAVEYFLKEHVNSEFIHFGLTSEDVNNLAYTLMLRDAVQQQYLPILKDLIATLKQRARKYKALAMLSLTHGQAATPTTVGKEFMVYVFRLQRQYKLIHALKLLGKFGGATGNWAALHVAYPNVNWLQFSRKFVQGFKLEFNPATTQIESHDSMVELYQALARVNSIVRDLDQDMWQYISRGLFTQHNIAGEIGSSAMPHKINPIFFENSEGNAGIANALFAYLAEKLPVSRMQRDLTDSTVLRNQGVAVAHSVLTLKNALKALGRVEANRVALAKELDNHWEVLAEPIQTVMRRLNKPTPYEQLKQLTRGHQLDQAAMHQFIDALDLPQAEKQNLKKLTPANYIGLSKQVAEL